MLRSLVGSEMCIRDRLISSSVKIGDVRLANYESPVPLCNTNTTFLTLKIPQSKFLLSMQSDALDERDIRKITTECEAGGCQRQDCSQRQKCIAIRRTRRRPGIISYLFAPCITSTQLPNVNQHPPIENCQQVQEDQEPSPSEGPSCNSYQPKLLSLIHI